MIASHKDMVNDAKIDKNVTKLGAFEEADDNKQEAECIIKLTDGGYFDSCEIDIYYEYINNKGEKVSKTEERGIENSEYEMDSSNRKIGVKFKVKVPKSATVVKVNYRIMINEAYVTVSRSKFTQNYKCIGIGGTHGSQNCHLGPEHVQNMSRTWEDETRIPEPKVLSGKLSSKDMPEYGNIRIIKVDQGTGKLVRNEYDNKGTAKFRICREDEIGKKVYLRSDKKDKDGHPETTSDKNAKSAIWEVDNFGEIDIENVPINEVVNGKNKTYTYYLEEIEPKLGYIKSSEKIVLDLSDNNITNKQKIKKSLDYFFTRNVVKEALEEKAKNNNGEINKSKYRRIVCNLIMGENLNSTSYEKKDWYKTYNNIKISSSPTNGEIKELITYLLGQCEDDGRLKDFFKTGSDKEMDGDYKGAQALVKMRKDLDITDKLTQGNIAKTYAYLEGYESIIVQNKQAKAYLRIQKKDIDTGEPLKGAIFRVTGKSDDGEENYDFHMETGEDGWTETSEVKFGTYEIEEIVPPTGYDLEMQDPNKTKKTITLKPKEGESIVEKQVTFVNKKFAAVKISKIDRESDQSMRGVKFQIRRQDLGKYMKILNGTQKVPIVEGEITLNPYYGTTLGEGKGTYHVEYVSNKEDATYFMTNASGEIEIKQLESHYGSTATKPGKPISYEIFETDTGETLGKYYAVSDRVYDLQIGELNAREAYIYTVKTMLEELTTDENYKFVKKDIIEKNLSAEEREKHVISLVQNITGHKLSSQSDSNHIVGGGEGIGDILAGAGVNDEEQKKLLEVIMKEYNRLYSDTSKSGIDVEIEFITDLVQNGIEKYSKEVNQELKKKYTDIIENEIKNFIPQKEDHEQPDDGNGLDNIIVVDIDIVNLENLGESIVETIRKKLKESASYWIDKEEKVLMIHTKETNNLYRYEYQIKKKNEKYTVSTDNTQNSYVKTMLTVRDVSKLEETNKKYVAEGLFSLYSNKPLKPSQKAHYVQLLQGKKILRIENTQTWVSLSGYVWEDISNSKDNTKPPSDGYYNQLEENKVGGIPVILRDSSNGGAIVKDKNGKELVTLTNANGEYRFDYITLMKDADENIYNLKNYYVEFQYDGFTYTSVITGNEYLSGTNTSKAKETDESRDELNNKFAKVEKEQTIAVSTIEGKENKDVKLEYTKEDKEATYINSHWNYTPSFNGQRIIIARRMDTVFDCLATTKETGYVIQRGEGEERYEIKNINLGLKQREMPNALIYNHDIDNIKVCINGHTNVYRYDQNMQSANKQPLQNGQVVANISSYVRWIAPSYIKSMEDLGSNHKIKIYVTYKITLQNASNTLTMKINTLDNYYDNRYLCDNISVGDTIINDNSDPNYYGLRKEGNKKISNQIMIHANNNGNPYTSNYAGYNIGVIGTTNGQAITELKAQEEATMYVQYQVKDEAIKEILNQSQTLSNIVEISSYTTYYGERTEPDTGTRRSGVRRTGELYAAVDSNSAPRNADLNKSEEYEDDTYSSPKVTLKVGDERAITGNVFEDLPEGDRKQLQEGYVATNKERKGNGIFEENKESKIKGVTVQLIPVEQQENGENTPTASNTGISNIYPANKATREIAQTQTNEEGKYEFKGIVPGHYIVRFTYGNETIGEKQLTAEKYKSTIRTGGTETGGEIDYRNPYWYQEEGNKPRYSDALDDETSRKEFNDRLSTIDYGVKTNFEKESKKHTVYAQTNTMDVAIEDIEKAVIEYYDQYYSQENGKGPSGLIKNIDFGLIERPKQKIEVKKVVKHVKITLANGIVLIDGNPETMNSQYVTYIKDSELVKIEVDNEILQGSNLEITYEIKVNNLSELDYSHMDYQWYGKKNAEIEKTLVTQTISKIIDNMDTELSTEYKIQEIEGIYKLADNIMRQLKNDEKLSEKTYNSIKNSNNILLLNNIQGLKNIKPSESGSVEVLATKMLTTTTTKDNYFENHTEIVENKNPAGKFTEDSTPGNADFSTIKGKEIDENGEALTIIPPTGGIKGWHIIVIGVVALTILVGGIILIKKKVLDESYKKP